MNTDEHRYQFSPGRLVIVIRIAISGIVSALLTCGALVIAQDLTPTVPVPKSTIKKVEAKPDTKAEAKAERLKAAKARRAAVVVANGNMNPMVQQFAQQGRPIVHAELLFVRHVCKLTPQQLRPISRETDQALQDVAKKMVEDQQNGVRIRVGRQAAATTPDAGKILQEALALVIKKHLTSEQYEHYRTEFDKRSANRKQAAMGFLVDVLDRELVLSSQQREKLTESLSAHWDDGWCMYMEYILYGNQFFPQGLDQYVTPVLNDNQKKVWQGVQKVQGFWGFGNVMGGMINDGDPLLRELGVEDDAAAKPAEAVKLKGAKRAVMKVEIKKNPPTKEAAIKK